MEQIKDLKEKSKLKYWLYIPTTIYSLLFPVLFHLALISVMVFDKPSMTVPIAMLFIIPCYAIPLSIPFSLFFMWRSYYQKQYFRVFFYCLLPLTTPFISYFFVETVEEFLKI